MLVATDLSKRFGGFLAVNRVSFEVREGEIVGLIGPNGSGKSTTFNLIAGTLRPTAGAIRFPHDDLTGPPAASGGGDPVPRRRHYRAAGARDLPLRDRAHVPDPASISQAVAHRQRHA